MPDNLIEDDLGLIWRSVRRADPRKAVRRLRTVTTRLHAGLRLRWLDVVFPPRRIDYEDSPYHLGWILYTWLTSSSASELGARAATTACPA